MQKYNPLEYVKTRSNTDTKNTKIGSAITDTKISWEGLKQRTKGQGY